MKKKISFKAWDTLLNNMANVDTLRINFSSTEDCYNDEPVKNNITKEDVKGLGLHVSTLNKRFILINSSPFTDIDGNQIYDGDLLQSVCNTGINIIFEVKQEQFYEVFGYDNSIPFNECRIVGNIYENPELIPVNPGCVKINN